ncbi:MAG: sarcosine oxidase subunit gamma family protein [Acidimicrobiales bacterium]
MADPVIVARSPIATAPPLTLVDGWEVSARRSRARLRLVDCTPVAKVLVRASADGATANALGVGHRRAARDGNGALVVGSGPGEWLLLAAPGTAAKVAGRVERITDAELVSVLDVTHGRVLIRLGGAAAASLLARVCAIDLADDVTPDGAAFRTAVAGVVSEVVRDDRSGEPCYLLACARDTGQYLFNVLRDAGAEFAADIDGFVPPGI